MANAVVVLPTQQHTNGLHIQNGHHPSNSAEGAPMAKTTSEVVVNSNNNSFWYLDNPSTRTKKDCYSGPYEVRAFFYFIVAILLILK